MSNRQFFKRGKNVKYLHFMNKNKWFHLKFESKVVLCAPTSLVRKNSEGKDEELKGYNVVLEDTVFFPEGGGQVSAQISFFRRIFPRIAHNNNVKAK